VNIINPNYPEPGVVGDAPPTNRYLLADDLVMASSQRLSAGLAQTLSRRVSANVLYSYAYRFDLLAGRNLNAPVAGVRPDPGFANVVLSSPDARGTQHSIHGSMNVNFGPLPPSGGPAAPIAGGPMMVGGHTVFITPAGGGPAASSGPRFSWRRGLSLSGFYNWSRTHDNTEGAFAIPVSTDLDDEWGPSNFDRRHNAHVTVTSSALRNFTARLTVGGSSAPPLTIRTGIDDNGDLVFNDRPAGVGRNSARTKGTLNSSANFGYSFTLGKKQVTTGGGVQVMGSPAGLTVNPSAAQPVPRYRLNLNVSIQNLLNEPVYAGFSGVMTSPFFLQPTSASGVRRVTFNMNVSF
jgi:hypothetical protein